MPSKYIIRGSVIIRSTRKAVANARVEAWDKDLILDDFVGNAITDENGNFEIHFSRKFFSEFFMDRKPDLYFKVFSGDDLIGNTENAVRWNIALHDLAMLIELEDGQPVQQTSKLTISGTVTHSTGNVIPALQVRISEQMLRQKKTITETVTDGNGKYSVAVELPGSNTAIAVEAIDAKQKVLAASATLFSPKGNQTADLVVGDDRFKGSSVFDSNNSLLQSYWSKLDKPQAEQPVSVNDIQFIAGQTGKQAADVWHYVYAKQLEQQTTIPAEIFYGLFRSGLPADINSLLNMGSTAIKEAITTAATSNFISSDTAAKADGIVKKWNNFSSNQLLNARSDNVDTTLADIFSLAVPDKEKQQQIVLAHTESNNDTDNFWKTVAGIAGDPASKQLNTAIQIAALTGLQPDMTAALFNEASSAGTSDALKDFAKRTADDWTSFVNDLSKKTGKSVVPVVVEANDETTRVNTYAKIIYGALETKYPTQAIIGNISKETAKKGAFAKTKSDLTTFFSNNPGFDIKSTPTISLLSEDSKAIFKGIKDKKAMVADLQSIQRLSSYTTSFASINSLKAKGLDSAPAILQLPKEKFVADLSADFESEQECLQVYNQATANYMHALALFGYVHPHLHSTGVTPDAPDLKELFGSLDSCDCEECNSIFSAAAYYTDCLDFLFKNAPLAYDELVRRRPDLIKILLSCKNTNRAMLYVDLVLEVLENFILDHLDAASAHTASVNFPGDPFFTDPNYQTTWLAAELAANPEHLNYAAYDILKKAVYPQQLPFNLPLEEARVYLKHLAAERYQVMATFFNGNANAAFSDAAISMERLMISAEETDILTGQTTGDGGATSGPWNFYGFTNDTSFNITDPLDASTPLTAGLWSDVMKGRVDIFLQQTGISYKDLVTLRLCDFINPVTNAATQKRKISIVPNATVPADEQDTCDLDRLILDGLDMADLKKMYRFIRLWHKTGWTMYELDLALQTFNPVAGTVAAWQDTLTKISGVNALCIQLNLPVQTLLSFYSGININTGYIDYFTQDYPSVISQYAKLFQNKQVIFPTDSAFSNPAMLAGNLDDHTAAIIAALQVSAKDYNVLKGPAVIPDNLLTLTNLSTLYRNALLANKLGLSARDFLAVKDLIGIDPFANPGLTYTFFSKVQTIKSSGFSIDLSNYLLRNSFTAETGVAPADDEIGLFLSELRAALRAIENLTPVIQKNTIAQKFSEKLNISTVAAIKLLRVYLPSTVNPGNPLMHIEDDFRADDFSTIPFLQTYNDPADPTLTKKIEPSKFVRLNPASVTEIAVPVLFDNYIKISKAATFITQLKLSDDELENILLHASAIGCTKLNLLPVAFAPNGHFDDFEILINLIRARDLLPLGTPGLFDILNHAIAPAADPTPALSWVKDLAKRTNWDPAIISILVITTDPTLAIPDGGILKAAFPNDFCNGDLILRINDCFGMLQRTGLSPAILARVIPAGLDGVTSQAIKNAVKSKYNEAQWLKLAKPLRDVLRSRQRESLVAYVVNRPDNTRNERWKDRNGMYNYFLIDVEMQPASITSRIKQAICTVQLFIDRVLMNLEFQNFDAAQPRLQVAKSFSDQWNEWRKVYRVWEANRQVFCYPENYVLPELRKDKSPIFKDLETELNQNELTEDNVQTFFGHYLEQLDEVGRLEVIGHFHHYEDAGIPEDKVDVLHVLARTYSYPQKYFHRTLDQGAWTCWLKLEIDVDGSHIVPVVFNGRLCLFWLFFTMQSLPKNSLNPQSSSISSPHKFWKIQVAWSVFHNGKWKPKRLSKNFISTDSLSNDEAALLVMQKNIWMRTEISGDNTLKLHVRDILSLNQPYGSLNYLSAIFHFQDSNSEPDIESGILNGIPLSQVIIFGDPADAEYENRLAIYNEARGFPLLAPTGTVGTNMQFVSTGSAINFCADKSYQINTSVYKNPNPGYTNPAGSGAVVLNKKPNGDYKLACPADFKLNPLETEFFFQDSKCTFYVTSGLDHTTSLNSPVLTFGPFRNIVPTKYKFKMQPDPEPMKNSIDVDPGLFFRGYTLPETNTAAALPDITSNVRVL